MQCSAVDMTDGHFSMSSNCAVIPEHSYSFALHQMIILLLHCIITLFQASVIFKIFVAFLFTCIFAFCI